MDSIDLGTQYTQSTSSASVRYRSCAWYPPRVIRIPVYTVHTRALYFPAQNDCLSACYPTGSHWSHFPISPFFTPFLSTRVQVPQKLPVMTQDVSFRYDEKKPSTYQKKGRRTILWRCGILTQNPPIHPPHHSLILIVFRFALVYFIFNLPYIRRTRSA